MIDEFWTSVDKVLKEEGYKLVVDDPGYKKYEGNSYLEISIIEENLPFISLCDERNCLKGYLTTVENKGVFVDVNGNLIYGKELFENENFHLYRIVNEAIKLINLKFLNDC